MNPRELSRLLIQSGLDAQKSQKERNILGQFATPSQLASDMLRHARGLLKSDEPVHFLDPAVGTGSFYSALLENFPDNQIATAAGFEIDPHYGGPAIDLWRSSSLNLQIGDFTALDPPLGSRRANLVICNPPYVRHHHISAAIKARLAAKVAAVSGLRIGGLAGLYCHFMAIAHGWMAEGGVAGWLIPSEFMDVNYGATIRQYLTESVELLQIHRFDPAEMQFGDALVSSAVVWFRKRKPPEGHVVKLSYRGSLGDPLISRMTPIMELRSSKKWSALAGGPVEVNAGRYKLSDFFRIKRGLATGDNKLFVLSEEMVGDLAIPEKFLTPLLPSPRHLASDVIEADANGRPLIPRRLYLLNCTLSEVEVESISPALACYLNAGREKALSTYICSRRSPWYSQEVRPPAPIVCTYMGRGLNSRKRPFRFLLNKSSATALNVYLMLYPTPLLQKAIALDPELISKIWKVLNNVPASALLGEGRVYGGGLYKMEPRELANLPADDIMALLPADKKFKDTQGHMFADLVA